MPLGCPHAPPTTPATPQHASPRSPLPLHSFVAPPGPKLDIVDPVAKIRGHRVPHPPYVCPPPLPATTPHPSSPTSPRRSLRLRASPPLHPGHLPTHVPHPRHLPHPPRPEPRHPRIHLPTETPPPHSTAEEGTVAGATGAASSAFQTPRRSPRRSPRARVDTGDRDRSRSRSRGPPAGSTATTPRRSTPRRSVANPTLSPTPNALPATPAPRTPTRGHTPRRDFYDQALSQLTQARETPDARRRGTPMISTPRRHGTGGGVGGGAMAPPRSQSLPPRRAYPHW